MKHGARTLLAGILLIACLALGLFLLRHENQKIRSLIAHELSLRLLHQKEREVRLEAESNARARVQEELAKARDEVAELERTAAKWHNEKTAKAARDANALLVNRDPGAGLTRLDNFQNTGSATPRAAFQTFVWAVTKGDMEMVSSLCVLEDPANEFARAMIADMPEVDRKNWTGEKLAGLFFQTKIAQYQAAQITGEERIDAQTAIVKLRAPGKPNEVFPMRLGSSGWQIVVSGQQISALKTKVPALLQGDFVELP